MRALRRMDGGFTLLEVIVAMAILAAGIVLVAQLLSGALRLSGGSRDVSESAIYARQRMEEALQGPNPVEGREQGTFNEKYRWDLTTMLVPREEDPFDEFRLQVTVRWMDGEEERSAHLEATRWVRRKVDAGT